MGDLQKSEDIYERLANALDALPHGFARTPSGVETEADQDGVHRGGGVPRRAS